MKATDSISRDVLRRATRRLLDRRFASWHAETPDNEVRREIRKMIGELRSRTGGARSAP